MNLFPLLTAFFITGPVAAGILILVLVFLAGVAVFAYLNEVIMRLPQKEGLLGKQRTCPRCGHVFGVKDCVPVVSYLLHRGKCAYCSERLPIRGLLIELLGGVLSVAVIAYYHFTPAALTMFLLYSVLTVITFIDADTQEIPPVLNIIIFVLGVLSIWTMPDMPILERIIGIFCISLPLYLIVLVIPDGFGGGDIKMMAAAGFFLGWKATLVAFFIGVVMGGAYGAFLLIAKKSDKKAHFAFGPFLSVGIAVSAYAGVGVMLMNHYLEPFKIMMQQM